MGVEIVNAVKILRNYTQV